jgi:hypothetical protein
VRGLAVPAAALALLAGAVGAMAGSGDEGEPLVPLRVAAFVVTGCDGPPPVDGPRPCMYRAVNAPVTLTPASGGKPKRRRTGSDGVVVVTVAAGDYQVVAGRARDRAATVVPPPHQVHVDSGQGGDAILLYDRGLR